MTYFLTLPDGAGHIDKLVNRYGRGLGRRFSEMTYQQLLRRGTAAPGTYVFTDRNRMTLEQRCIAGSIRRCLLNAGPDFRVIGAPESQLGRVELLSRLANDGINDYRAYRATEVPRQDLRFPVFVRIENDHMGPRSELLNGWDAVVQSVSHLVLAGFKLSDVLITEFMEVKDGDGVRRKYGAYRIGEHLFCQHIYHSEHWLGKSQTRLLAPELLAESDRLFEENPHRDLLMPIFECAGIEYGRIDYGFANGRVQVWEINDNPMFMPGAKPSSIPSPRVLKYLAGFESLASGDSHSESLTIRIPVEELRSEVNR